MRATVNGSTASLDEVTAHTNALDWLRDQGLTGAKEGCAEGECGACSVLVARPDADGSTTWTAINACLIPALSLEEQTVITAEGLGEPGDLHPVQQEMAVRGGSQCGYCTPGFVCSMAAEYYRKDRVPASDAGSEADEHGAHECGPNGFDLHALSGNLCRCTGYRPIRDAAYALGIPEDTDELVQQHSQPAPAPAHTDVTVAGARYVRPQSLAEAIDLLASDDQAQLVAGSTDWGVAANLMMSRATTLVAIDRLAELRDLTEDETGFTIGAALTLSEIERRLAGRIPLLDKLFPQFASRLIRNGGTFGGNLGTGSPIGDSPPALLALEASLLLAGPDGERSVPLAEYFTGYRQSVREKAEIIKAVVIPKPLAAHTAFHKIAKRRFDDISSVAVGLAIDLSDGVVSRARIGLGGVAATPLRATAAEAVLEGRPWTAGTVREAAAALADAGTPMSDHRASSAYRTAMLRTALHKFYVETTSVQEVSA
ncbi:xanthine dehydrogenase small subunit [Branchiibius hedensis]|uniref:Xanthine dehydrogenase small subunit n=1 Tax=Branchiibius hedensis TaxID=672460 RepID=A0A2Y8ZW94_9MICO|nr:FAD binding domain-containing protein [Branchiibius hedensis]PWJ27405.1 xanthine dehydrogenase small subunit [Branchiibius hedensis]SSA36215.1 xanthine dehydrogenase small subunit [Branchiibius hedensis]